MRPQLAAALLVVASTQALAGTVFPDSLLAPGLAAAGLGADELTCFPESTDPDPFRLPLVQAIMERNVLADSLLPGALDALFAPASADPVPTLAALVDLLHPSPPRPENVRPRLPRGGAPEDFFAALLPPLLERRSAALAALDPAERALLVADSPGLLDEDALADTDAIQDPVRLRHLEAAASAHSDSLLGLWAKVDRAALARLGADFVRDAYDYAMALGQTPSAPTREAPNAGETRHAFPDGSVAEGPLLHAAATPWGNIAVGGRGANRYRGRFLFVLDLGGDDSYALDSCWPTAGALADDAGFRCLVDLAGDDHWDARESGALAGAFLGAALLVDAAGDDVYRARDFDLGCGWLGVGALLDRAGEDLYSGGTAVMGAGGGGLGLLVDEGGADVYRAALYAQGFAWVGGAGVLHDLAGGDVYAVAPVYTDILRYEDHALSLSQGFSIGARPNWSGGLGILRDDAGNDAYSADIYGQGAAYWYGLGLLQDRAGNDSYTAYQYSQGAGIHLALGFLLDDAGNDSYASHGVGQGCGHDLALGLLRDASGNDRYACDDLSQGAGSANGIGILLDGAGLDGYLAKSVTAPAYGNPRRHYGSVGLLVDGSGDDWFSKPGEPGETHGSLEGTLLDMDRALPGPVWEPGPAVAFRDSAWSVDDYFLMAASGEPRFRDWHQAGLDTLIARGASVAPALIARFDTDVARERHTLKDVFKGVGAPMLPALRAVLREGEPAYWRQAAWCLEEIREPAAFDELLGLLDAPRDFRDAVSALAALARLEGLGAAERDVLLARCETLAAEPGCHPLVLKEIAYLLGEQQLDADPLLVRLAAAEHYAPRWMARRALEQREGWGRPLALAWRRALAARDGARASRLARLLALRPEGEVAIRLREWRRSGLADDPSLRAALRRALDAHPDVAGRRLAAARTRLD